MNTQELVKLKNIDLSITECNEHVERLLKKGFIDKRNPDVKKCLMKYESIRARFDTNSIVKKKDGGYILPLKITNNVIKGIQGITKNIQINSEEGK